MNQENEKSMPKTELRNMIHQLAFSSFDTHKLTPEQIQDQKVTN